MSAVTDPDLLAKLEGKATPGGPVVDPALLARLEGAATPPPPVVPQAPPAAQTAPPGEAPRANLDQQLEGGARHALQSNVSGLYRTMGAAVDALPKSVGPLSLLKYAKKGVGALDDYARSKGYGFIPTEANLKAGREFTAEYPIAKAAEIGTDIGIQLLPGMGAEAALAKAAGTAGPVTTLGASKLVNAVDAARRVGVPIAANAATAATFAPDDKWGAAGGAALGTQVGSLAGKAVGYGFNKGRKGANWLTEELLPGKARVDARASNRLEQIVNPYELDRVTAALRDPKPSFLPMTTAAAAESPAIGAIERGMTDDAVLGAHRVKVAKKVQDEVMDATRAADTVLGIKRPAGAAYQAGQDVLDRTPFSRANRQALQTNLRALQSTNLGQKGTAEGNAAIEDALRVVEAGLGDEGPRVNSLGVLVHIREKYAGTKDPVAASVRDMLDDMLNQRGKGRFDEMNTAYSAAMRRQDNAEAAERIRERFMGPGNIPKTKLVSGMTGVGPIHGPPRPGQDLRANEATAEITSNALRRGTAAEVGRQDPTRPYLDRGMVSRLNQISDEVSRQEIGQQGAALALPKSTTRGPLEAALNVTSLWTAKPALRKHLDAMDDATLARVHDAVRDPDSYLALMQAKRLRGQKLAAWEREVEEFVRGIATSGGAIGANVGEKRAP